MTGHHRYGKIIAPILIDTEKYQGKNSTCATAFYTPIQLVEGWSKVTGKQVTYKQVGGGQIGGNMNEEMDEELKGSIGGMGILGQLVSMIWSGRLSRWKRCR